LLTLLLKLFVQFLVASAFGPQCALLVQADERQSDRCEHEYEGTIAFHDRDSLLVRPGAGDG
jgi:hypothetical protein